MNFLRTSGHNKIKLGYGKSKRNQKWRKARGRHNKIREKRKGRRNMVEIGYRTNKETRGKVNGQDFTFIANLNDLAKVKKNGQALIARLGKRKRTLIENKLKEMGVKILN